MNEIEKIIHKKILKIIEDDDLLFNNFQIYVEDHEDMGEIVIRQVTSVTNSFLLQKRKLNFDALELMVKRACWKTQRSLIEEIGQHVEKDKDGLKLIVSKSIPEDTILCNPYTSTKIGMLNDMLRMGSPSFRLELNKILNEGVTCEIRT